MRRSIHEREHWFNGQHPSFDEVLDETEDLILNASDEEILQKARAEGRDPDETSKRVKGILRKAVEQSTRTEG